jgi:hypothetical protein
MASEARRLVSFRLPESDLDLLDALADKFSKADGVVVVSRTDVVRKAIQFLARRELPDLFKSKDKRD